jgi:hypothetical protein
VRAFTDGQGSTIAGPATDIAVGDLDGQPGDELVVTGEQTQVIHL